MAEGSKKFKLSQSNRARILMIAVLVIGAVLVGASLFHIHRSRQKNQASSSLGGVPSGIQSLPGGKQASQQYLKVLLKQNQLKANNALKSGKSAIPTMVNTGQTYIQTSDFKAKDQGAQCNCPLPGLQGSGASLLDQLAASGAITPSVAADLHRLQNQGASVEDYANELQKLVAEGKLTPAQAAKLLAAYRAKHGAAAAAGAAGTESPADIASDLLASGAITPETAQELAQLNNKKLTPEEYAAELQRLVREGKLTPAQARALMAAYNRKHGEATAAAVGSGSTPDDVASQLLASGSITPATERELAALNSANLTPAQARALLAAYRRTHGGTGTASVFARHSALLGQLKNSGQISGQAAAELERLSAQNTPSSEYATQLANLVRSGKLSPAVAQRLLNAYMAKHGAVTLSDKAKTNPQLAQLERMRQQQQLRVQQQVLAQLQQQRQREQAQKTQQQLKSMENAMRSQSSALFASWAAPTPTMSSVGSSDATKKGGGAAAGAATGGAAAAAGSGGKKLTVPLVKTGSIMFAVLNTAINSDMPGVVMATIVSGKYKGAKLMGGLTLKKDRVELAFTSMSMADWPSVVTIKAVAINPDTARTAIASSVNHHYVSRYGALMASSFLEGYSQAVSNSGNTTISGDGTVTSSTATYSPAGRFMIALGNVGSKLGSAAEQNFNRSPTVKIDAGVGLGILFQGDVSTPDFLLKKVGDSTSSDGSTDNE
ncbi:MAG: hypothetical protein GY782_10805 [Gammaproteobacteria bacterium]|nr:hypothetical protein [Gammaproteobacteria bacterium]